MSEHRSRIILAGGDPIPVDDGIERRGIWFPHRLRGFETVGKEADVVWRDGDPSGEILVSADWKRHAGTASMDAAMARADALAGRAINWRFVA